VVYVWIEMIFSLQNFWCGAETWRHYTVALGLDIQNLVYALLTSVFLLQLIIK